MSRSDLDTQFDESADFMQFFGGSFEGSDVVSTSGLLNSYIPVFLVSFIATILITPLVRTLAVNGGVVDRPDGDRKIHKFPIAYLGGLAVMFGISAAMIYSYLMIPDVPSQYDLVPLGVLLGMFAIGITGFMDDVWHWDPRLKIAGQLVAAAGLAISDVGVNVATGLLWPLLGSSSTVLFHLGGEVILTSGDAYYWLGTVLIAVFVLGGCNAANLIDGLDGLLSGTAAIMALGFLAISIMMAVYLDGPSSDSSLAGARIIMSLALLGAVLGFLPYNFNPAAIFLGDCGSLLIGYMCVTIILMFGETGQTHLVIAGLIIFCLPIMDTVLAIIRRKLSGQSMSAADNNHIHHMVFRATGSVKSAVFALYGLSTIFMLFGVSLAGIYLAGVVQGRVLYGAFLVIFSFISAIAIKTARKKQWESMGQSAGIDEELPETASAPAPQDPVTTPHSD